MITYPSSLVVVIFKRSDSMTQANVNERISEERR
jgi:hypothetical protein